MALGTIRSREPILGYEVTERIGAGGYGEVWRATAPGGLVKAIKYVYGFLDDERAKRELKALSRVKQVRHPFLLSLERIEVVDGQLVIVTELADMSLKDRHDQCKAAGMVGIPRHELLGYLRDAADALDYMREKYSLQHLDIKPENLLIMGGHVKVADFGLVKDIADTRASMMGGLTPLYASPEVFDDRPSQCSDQYSLAIVFQEMLTDTLPFPGKTTAQLAAQHLQSRPRLTALSPLDKPIVDRALEKQPEKRFADCRELIDALIAAGRAPGTTTTTVAAGAASDTTPLTAGSTHPAKPSVTPAPARPAADVLRTQTLDECRAQRIPAAEPLPAAAPRTRSRAAPVVSDLEPLEVAAGPYLRPALFVAIGGTAALALGRLRQRLEDRFGDLARVPAFRLLAIDTDGESLEQNRPPARGGEAAAHQTLRLSLKKTDEYRADSSRLLRWMSRRWLYNIPRSLATEGLRPLGRLALVDHAETLLGELRSALAAITDAAACATTSDVSGQPLAAGTPRVFLVASISGGAGGGMVLDVAYALKKLLADRGISEDALAVLLLHGTGRNPATHDLSIANAYAALSEMSHYCEQGYPGEPACELTPVAPAHAGLSNTYFVHLGDDLSECDRLAATDKIADYLYLSAATPASNWFDAARQSSAAPVPDHAPANDDLPAAQLRTFGLCELRCSDEVASSAADRLCMNLVERWLGQSQNRAAPPAASVDCATAEHPAASWTDTDIERTVRERCAAAALSVDELIDGFDHATTTFLGDIDVYLAQEIRRILAAGANIPPPVDEEDRRSPLVAAVDARFTPATIVSTSDSAVTLAAALEAHLNDAVGRYATEIRSWANEIGQQPAAGVAVALRVVEYAASHVREMREAALKLRGRATEELRAAAAGLDRPKPRGRLWARWPTASHAENDSEARLCEYGNLKFLDYSLNCVVRLTQRVSAEISSIVDPLKDIQRRLATLGREFAPQVITDQRTAMADGEAADEKTAAAVRETLERRMPELVARLDAELRAQFALAEEGFWSTIMQRDSHSHSLYTVLGAAARALVLEEIRTTASGQKLLAQDVGAAGPRDLLRACLADAAPTLIACGGQRRLLIATADQVDIAPLAEAVVSLRGQSPSFVVDSGGEPALCYEFAAMSLWQAAASLVEGQPQCVQLARRLHTRCDVEWSRLGDEA